MKTSSSLRNKLFIGIFALFMVGITSPLYANLLITPLQVVMEGRDRSTEITLVNPSENTNTYRLGWVQLKQVQGTGGYIKSTDEERAAETDLEDFAVFSPRQVTLKPDEKQVVRVGIRRPAELADGEYKSHLRFEIVPELSIRKNTLKDPGDGKIQLGVKMMASYSIPIIYRSGDYDAQFDIGQPSFSVNPKNNRIIVNLPITRTGKHGAVGQINIFHKPNSGGEEKLIAQQGNANIFNDITRRDFNVMTTETSLSPGTLRIQYIKSEGRTNEYKLLNEKVFPVQN